MGNWKIVEFEYDFDDKPEPYLLDNPDINVDELWLQRNTEFVAVADNRIPQSVIDEEIENFIINLPGQSHFVQIMPKETYQRLFAEKPVENVGNVIFLDVDGVLNCSTTTQTVKHHSTRKFLFTGIDPKKVENLKAIADEYQAIIVLSSSWKDDWLENSIYGRYLNDNLKAFGLTIYDCTTDMGWNRGEGIRNWLNVHPHDKWIAIDDEVFRDFGKYHISEHLLKTDMYHGGLTKNHVQRARKFFEREDNYVNKA